MKFVKRLTTIPKRNTQLSLAVRSKFSFLLLITLALIFDIVVQPVNPKLSESQFLPEINKAK